MFLVYLMNILTCIDDEIHKNGRDFDMQLLRAFEKKVFLLLLINRQIKYTFEKIKEAH